MNRYIVRQYENASFILDKHSWDAQFFEGDLAFVAIKCFDDPEYELEESFYADYSDEDCKSIAENFYEIKESINTLLNKNEKKLRPEAFDNSVVSDAFSQLSTYARNSNQITNANIELTGRCNLNCDFCYVDSHTESGLEKDTIKKIAEDLKAIGVVFVLLTGGEIFVRKDIFDIIEIFDNLGFALEIKTNGLLLDSTIIERLSHYKLYDLQMSIYEIENGFSKMCNSFYDFNKIENNIKELLKCNISFTLSVLVGKHNINRIRDIHKKLRAIGDVEIFYSPYLTPNRNNNAKALNYRLTKDELITLYYPFIKEINAIPNLKQYRNCNESDLVCYAGKDQLAIYADGTVTPCLDLNIHVGNVKSNSLMELVDKVPEIMSRFSLNEIKSCVSCTVRNYCDSCIGVAITENSDYRNPLQHKCDISQFYFEIVKYKVN